jgi:hypothetical protein
MAEYMLLIVGDDDAYQALSAEDGKRVYGGHMAFITALNEAGVKIVSSAQLDTPSGARTLHADGLVTDGPFAEGKEQVGGYYSIDVPGIDEAVEWARKIPLLPGDRVEVRRTR